MLRVAVIPARGGSKGIPRKNLAEVQGKSLVQLAIESAKDSQVIDHIVVTSDDLQILEIANSCGALTVHRPAELSSDTSSVESAIEHALRELSQIHLLPELLVLLQPTSPLRKSATIAKAVDIYTSQGCSGCVFGVIEAEHHPYKTFITNDAVLSPVGKSTDLSRPRQDLPRAFRQSGSIYVVGVADFLASNSLYIQPARWIEVDSDEAIDIDTPADLYSAQQVSKKTNE